MTRSPEELLPLAALAQIAAQVDAGRSRDAVLVGAGVSSEQFEEAQRAWLDKMSRDVARRDFAVQRQYAQLYADARAEVEKQGLGMAAPVVVPPVVAPPVVVPPVVAPPVVAPPVVAPPPVVSPPLATPPAYGAGSPRVAEPPSVGRVDRPGEPPFAGARADAAEPLEPPRIAEPPRVAEPPRIAEPPPVFEPPPTAEPPSVAEPPPVAGSPAALPASTPADPPPVVEPPRIAEPPVAVPSPVATPLPVPAPPPIAAPLPVAAPPPAAAPPPVVGGASDSAGEVLRAPRSFAARDFFDGGPPPRRSLGSTGAWSRSMVPLLGGPPPSSPIGGSGGAFQGGATMVADASEFLARLGQHPSPAPAPSPPAASPVVPPMASPAQPPAASPVVPPMASPAQPPMASPSPPIVAPRPAAGPLPALAPSFGQDPSPRPAPGPQGPSVQDSGHAPFAGGGTADTGGRGGLAPLSPSFGGPSDAPALRPLAPSFDLASPPGPSPQPAAGRAPGMGPAGPAGPPPIGGPPVAAPAGPPAGPLSPSAENALRSLSVEQYACLEAELLAHPAREAAVLQRYELDGAALQALRHRYQTQFAGDPALHGRFSRLVEHYRSSFGSR